MFFPLFTRCCDCLLYPFFKRTYVMSEDRLSLSEKGLSFIKFSEKEDNNHDIELLPMQQNLMSPLLMKNNEELGTSTLNQISEAEKNYEKISKELIEELKNNVLNDLSGFERVHEDLKTNWKLSIYLKSIIDEKTNNRINIYRSEYIVPCEPKKFIKFLNDIKEQAEISTNIEKYLTLKHFGKNDSFCFVYLKYKKVLIVSPRDFYYFKFFEKIDEEHNIWVDCSKSIINEETVPEIPEIIRGNINLTGYYIQPFEFIKDDIKYNYSKVKWYSDVDLKMNVPPFIIKSFGINELKKYVEKTYLRIEELEIIESNKN